MSRVGKKPISIPSGVDIKINKNMVSVKGELGELSLDVRPCIKLDLKDDKLLCTLVSKIEEDDAKYGLYRSLLNNMVIGVSSGFSKTLKIVGVGYRVKKKDKKIEILAGYSNPVVVSEENGVTFDIPDNTTIVVKGPSKKNVGEMAAKIRNIRKPEPYKGKGIKYIDEVIKRKVGKAAITETA